MLGERAQRQVDRFLDEAEEALARSDWATMSDRSQAVLNLDPGPSERSCPGSKSQPRNLGGQPRIQEAASPWRRSQG